MWRRKARIFVENVLIQVGLESRSIYSQCFLGMLKLPKTIAGGVFPYIIVAFAGDYPSP